MKKTVIALAVALASTTTAQAAPKEGTAYAGAKVGWSHYFFGSNMNNDGPTHRDDVGGSAFVGYQITPYVAAEFAGDYLGRARMKGDHRNGAFKAQGLQLSAKVGYPFRNNIEPYVRAGAMLWQGHAEVYDTATDTRLKGRETGLSPLAAAGIEYEMTKKVAARLEYQWVHDIGDKNRLGARPDNSYVNVGVSYRFGDQGDRVIPAPIPVAVPVPAPTPEVRRFTLKSDVLFAFNKATLRKEGRHELDQLYAQLRGSDKMKDTVLVIGHTDRIGSEKYNHTLSEKRAHSVVAYLVSRGIPAENISARGVGKAEPVTGHTCNGIKNRKHLISCLAPDRRVEIEIQGVKKTAPASSL